MLFCGPKVYTIDDTLTSIVAPATGPEVNPWTISAFTNDIALVGSRVVTVTSTLQDYPTVPAVTVTFNLVVIDNCETAVLQPQSLQDMFYGLFYSTNPAEQTF